MAESQEIMKGGEKPTTFTYDEALEMLKARDAEWEEKIAKANTLIEFQKMTINQSDSVIAKLEEQILTLSKDKIISDLSEGLVDTQKAKFKKLTADITFESAEQFAEKAQIVRESYFSQRKEEVQEELRLLGVREEGALHHPAHGEEAVVLLVRHRPRLLQHRLRRRRALQPAALAHGVPA